MSARFPDLPARMMGLPVDHRGFPVPWFVAWVDGEPQFPVADGRKLGIAHKFEKCWVCGSPLGRYRASVIGPMCAINRTISEPQSHVDCAIFSARNCPFLSRPRMKRVGAENLPMGVISAAGNGILRNPGVACVWVERAQSQAFRVGNGVLFRLGDPTEVHWFAEGRAATAREIMESIDSGMPLLVAETDKELPWVRDKARQELRARYREVVRLVDLTAAGDESLLIVQGSG